jgi:hypothetical protein
LSFSARRAASAGFGLLCPVLSYLPYSAQSAGGFCFSAFFDALHGFFGLAKGKYHDYYQDNQGCYASG